MNELDYLRKVWEENTIADTSQDAPVLKENMSMVKKLKSFDHFQKLINILKIVIITILLSTFMISIKSLGIDSVEIYIGISIIFAGIISFMFYYLKNQFYSSKLDYTQSSTRFAKDAISLLKKQNNIFGLPFILFILTLIVGINVLFLGIPSEPQSVSPLFMHITVSSFMALSGLVGYRIRRWRIRKEIYPLIADLSQLENQE